MHTYYFTLVFLLEQSFLTQKAHSRLPAQLWLFHWLASAPQLIPELLPFPSNFTHTHQKRYTNLTWLHYPTHPPIHQTKKFSPFSTILSHSFLSLLLADLLQTFRFFSLLLSLYHAIFTEIKTQTINTQACFTVWVKANLLLFYTRLQFPPIQLYHNHHFISKWWRPETPHQKPFLSLSFFYKHKKRKPRKRTVPKKSFIFQNQVTKNFFFTLWLDLSLPIILSKEKLSNLENSHWIQTKPRGSFLFPPKPKMSMVTDFLLKICQKNHLLAYIFFTNTNPFFSF